MSARAVHLMSGAHVQRTACGRYVNESVQREATPLWSPELTEVTCKSCSRAATL